MSRYKDLEVWKKSHNLALSIYHNTKHFPDSEKFGLISQMRRAATSIPTNIAEGQGRSNNKEFINFLRISKGSATEVEYLLLLSLDLGYISKDIYLDLNGKTEKILAMLNNLMKSDRKSVV